jgi:dihydroorotate dehydrogenase (NAD+) catalytic subunit
MNSSSLAVDIGGIRLQNPVIVASGTFGYGREFSSFYDLSRLGALVTKGLSLEPAPGNPPPRTVETCGGMINAIGLENVGLEVFAREKLPFLRTLNTAVIVNLYGKQVEEYGELARRVDGLEGVAGIELNISCPNVKAGGMAFGTDPEAAYAVTRAARDRTALPLIVKLSPNVTDIATIAQGVEKAGADAVSLINTVSAMAVDVATRKPKLGNKVGGLSGPAIKPIALRMVWETARAVDIPVVGIGGIMNTTDALEFLIVGATAIQIGTANLVNPMTGSDIVEGLERYMEDHGFTDIREVIGSLEESVVP